MSKSQLNRSLHEQETANRKINRLRHHGTRREKTLIRQWRACLPTHILAIIKELK
ncbi:hypothetical protein [Burkholderia ubonensis]|uniref:hypothetical protein n=1 Tax=Burkholderia ubonensis TaxID=101571 RepID=UPI000A64A1CB|nr:hypothetical protein [Burkholderia ubonensis]